MPADEATGTGHEGTPLARSCRVVGRCLVFHRGASRTGSGKLAASDGWRGATVRRDGDGDGRLRRLARPLHLHRSLGSSTSCSNVHGQGRPNSRNAAGREHLGRISAEARCLDGYDDGEPHTTGTSVAQSLRCRPLAGQCRHAAARTVLTRSWSNPSIATAAPAASVRTMYGSLIA